jgi:hypothetical protein
VAIVGRDDNATSPPLFDIMFGEATPTAGEVKWGTTITPSYFLRKITITPVHRLNLVGTGCVLHRQGRLRARLKVLGRMLFSGDRRRNPTC